MEPSHIPETINSLRVELDISKAISSQEYDALHRFCRCANYIAAAMIFLKDNALMERKKLERDDIKDRLLGHWGTCPGLNLVYAHLNLIIRKYQSDVLYVVGPGHGAPAILASLWLESSLEHFYPDQYPRNQEGLKRLITTFSTPTGFPSHVNAQFPGCIHEGGELGYALGVAFGAVMDNPDLVVACVVGDGEAETGPTATAWHAYKYIDPKESGAVLPIVHVNGFKISEPTIYGKMDDKELVALFTGYGYQVRFVEDLDHIHHDLQASMSWALQTIKAIQTAARSGQPITKPRWPVLILRTPKGWTGPKVLHGKLVEGTFRAHQVPLPSPKQDPEQMELLQRWLEGYAFNAENIVEELKLLDDALIPTQIEKRMGMRKEAYNAYKPLDVGDWTSRAVAKDQDGGLASSTKVAGHFLKDVIQRNPTSMRIFSPDELESNKLDAVLEVTTRNFQWDPETRNKGGRVIEILSEHTCQAMLQGYTLTGRIGLLPSYESFLGIVHTMMVQYGKFNKMAKETGWRPDVGSLNYLESSTWTRQEHNGFSHQNPSFVGAVLNLKPSLARVYLPPDANCLLSTMAHCLGCKNYINLVVASKHPTPIWLSPEEAQAHCKAGASVFKFASTDEGLNPDVVLVGIGVETTFEVIAAASLLRKIAPDLRVRVVNVTDLMILSNDRTHPHALTDAGFDELFTPDRPIHFNYHSYPVELKGLLFGRRSLSQRGRVTIHGYKEEGTTTTPLRMLVLNELSRWHVAAEAVQGGAIHNPKVRGVEEELLRDIAEMVEQHKEYAFNNSKDPDDIFATPKF